MSEKINLDEITLQETKFREDTVKMQTEISSYSDTKIANKNIGDVGFGVSEYWSTRMRLYLRITQDKRHLMYDTREWETWQWCCDLSK